MTTWEELLRQSVGPREAWAMVTRMCKMKLAEQESFGRTQLALMGSGEPDQKAAMRTFWDVFDACQAIAFDGKSPSLLKQQKVPKGYLKRSQWFRD